MPASAASLTLMLRCAVTSFSYKRTPVADRPRANQGVKLILENHPSLRPLIIFVAPPSLQALGQRLNGRGTETAESLKSRIGMAKSEISFAAVRRTCSSAFSVLATDSMTLTERRAKRHHRQRRPRPGLRDLQGRLPSGRMARQR